jgi:hypothetical protein
MQQTPPPAKPLQPLSAKDSNWCYAPANLL